MQQERPVAGNPLSALALESPPVFGVALSIGGRVIAAALALYIAADQPYDPTQVFAIGLATIAMVSLAPMPGGLGTWISGLAAGTLFFSAALLFEQAAGVGMLITSVAAMLGILVMTQRAGREAGTPLGAFFFGLGVTAAWWSLTFLITEGGLPFEGVLPL